MIRPILWCIEWETLYESKIMRCKRLDAKCIEQYIKGKMDRPRPYK